MLLPHRFPFSRQRLKRSTKRKHPLLSMSQMTLDLLSVVIRLIFWGKEANVQQIVLQICFLVSIWINCFRFHQILLFFFYQAFITRKLIFSFEDILWTFLIFYVYSLKIIKYCGISNKKWGIFCWFIFVTCSKEYQEKKALYEHFIKWHSFENSFDKNI